MPLHVICPGCLKRFQVGERFAGMKGPCPSCGVVISIPKGSIKIHGADDVSPEKEKKRRTPTRPISRLNMEFDPVQVRRYTLIVLGVLFLALLLGYIPMYSIVRSLIGFAGLCFVAFPLALFGYHTVRDREQMFAFTGEELYRRTGIVAAGYVLLWLGFEYCLAATQADSVVSWFYFAAFAILAALLAHPLLKMNMWDSLLHYCVFGFTVIVLRFLIAFGWFWESSSLIRHSTAPPPPFLPGM
jgi:hypothetical protein